MKVNSVIIQLWISAQIISYIYGIYMGICCQTSMRDTTLSTLCSNQFQSCIKSLKVSSLWARVFIHISSTSLVIIYSHADYCSNFRLTHFEKHIPNTAIVLWIWHSCEKPTVRTQQTRAWTLRLIFTLNWFASSDPLSCLYLL